jgi:ubiquinone/menaquinone biosynthesis C-methylase UbiE
MSQPMSPAMTQPTPEPIFALLNAFQQTEALKAALELELFTAIAEGNNTVEAIAKRCQASMRGTRILCDYFVVMRFLEKKSDTYHLTREAALFLDRRSPAYMGGAVGFLLHPASVEPWKNVAGAVRKGGTVTDLSGTLAPAHPIWVEFARSMAPLMAVPAEMLAKELKGDGPCRVLGLASGHGLYEIAIARQNSQAEAWLVDWPNVLQVAEENAKHAGVSERVHTIPGSAFEVEFGSEYDVALLPNFIHHFDPQTAEKLLRKVQAALKPGGRAVIVQFVPNEDRVSPPRPASFSLILLVTTPSGEAYTYSDLQRMLTNAGFSSTEQHPLIPDFFTVVTGTK